MGTGHMGVHGLSKHRGGGPDQSLAGLFSDNIIHKGIISMDQVQVVKVQSGWEPLVCQQPGREIQVPDAVALSDPQNST